MEVSIELIRFTSSKIQGWWKGFLISIVLLMLHVPALIAGPYPPAAGEVGSSAIHMDDPAFVDWASGYEDYRPGSNVDAGWQIPERALGKAVGTSFEVVSLGRGGRITLTFDMPIENGEGWDFAVFENAVNNHHLELGYVEVSTNGEDFVRFDSISLTPDPVGGFGSVDASLVDGLAGKYRQAYGTPFDLSTLSGKNEVQSGVVDLSRIFYVRIIDIIGDGTYSDSAGNVIYDPYPTFGSAGFDLDAIGVSNGAPFPQGPADGSEPPPPEADGDAGFGGNGGCFIGSVL